jgi:prepilin-type N-terminal cleavage/methylation domain-containing protein
VRPGTRAGFTLVEVLVALTILAVGVLGTAATLLAARRALVAAERLHVATQAGAGIADSLLRSGVVSAGALDAEWGALRWSREASGVRVIATDPGGATLLQWWFLAPGLSP